METWAEAFNIFEFQTEDKKIMNNFNLHYECLDERDDYHAILKQQSKMNQQHLSEYNHIDSVNDYDFGISTNIEEDYGDPSILGPNAIKKAQQMIETEIILNQAGWLDQQENLISQSTIHAIHPAEHKSGTQWKHVVKQCQDHILNIKKIYYSYTISKLNNLKIKFCNHLLSSYSQLNIFFITFNQKIPKIKILY